MDFVLVPLCFVHWIGAHGDDDRVQLLKFRITLRELTEFDAAVSSPIPFVEIEEHIVAGELRQPD